MNRLDFFWAAWYAFHQNLCKNKKYKNDQTRKCFGTASTLPLQVQFSIETLICLFIGPKKWEEKSSYFRVLSI